MQRMKDCNIYFIGARQVPRGEALKAVYCDQLIPLLSILTLDKSSPRMGVWTPQGLVYRQSTINGR